MTEPPVADHPEAPPAGTEPAVEPAPERQSTPFLVLQFFIFPMAIVAVCVTVFVIFGLISSEQKSARAYLAEVRSGGGMFNVKRWQAAFSLANALEAEADLARRDPAFVAEAVELFEQSKGDDPRIRRYLALALGRLHDPRAVPALVAAVDDAGADTETIIYSVWALGAIGDPAAVPVLTALAGHADRGIRKAAVHAVGVFPGDQTGAALAGALEDAADDVRWNAALALARRGDARAVPVLLQMMDRAHLAGVQVPVADGRREPLGAEQADQAVLQAVSVSPKLSDPGLQKAVAALAENDPSLKVRAAARAALAGR